jgi:hypothetical protein
MGLQKSRTGGKWCQLKGKLAGRGTVAALGHPKGTAMQDEPLENLIRVFHEDCGGIAVGPLNDLHCAECGKALELRVVEREL